MVWLPTFWPETKEVPVVEPSGMTMVAGVQFTFLLSNPSVTELPPSGAGCDKVKVRVAGACANLIVLVLRDIDELAGLPTVMFAVRSGNPGALTRITAVPIPTAVTLNPTTEDDRLRNISCGTNATDVLEEVNVNVVSAGIGPESFKAKVTSAPGPTRTLLAGVSVALRPTVTSVEAGVKPLVDAVIVAEPSALPLSTTARLGVVWPALKVTPPVMVAFDASLVPSCT